jgi:hypothetical protein
MSELPKIDELKVEKKNVQKLRLNLAESENRESTLEALAEALRDERDEARAKLAEAESKLASSTPVADISSLPPQ